ncbi:mitochondrial K+-H+ exchange-related-domain-containing protein [Daldinia loculata]|uniref:mitochondrial K+-H+ exchange-related-domain-containing protein n=1 Tax=Daldinia loculata TaxID=103429 RepID=UPI0020C3B7D1|nr:mitochondrial K+-H+ exchange-related-domain-containing protein [Daldinia loculata]KAI1648648.1 mitochondrial K+-H+ exchange-related-domain-containing protein [Daldinia loculata]KAI2782473.1 mitochondrial K+-H+ exchange-related-domain-containing protein [Daldinia loculata]
MRFFLLPISTRRTLLYCQKVQVLPKSKQTLVDKATVRASQLWSDWEKKENGWQKKVVVYGNSLLKRIPFEEWGLKSVPPLSTRRREEEVLGKDKNHLIYPETVIPTTKAVNVLRTLGTEREALHRTRLMWCFIGMPISAPFALVPVIPNLPFFYLVYRAWSHWRALAGGKHIQFLCEKNLLTLSPSPVLDSIYAPLLPDPLASKEQIADTDRASKSTAGNSKEFAEERMLLSQENRRQLVKALEIPELEVELERAIWQVETAIQKEQEEKSKPPDTEKPK